MCRIDRPTFLCGWITTSPSTENGSIHHRERFFRDSRAVLHTLFVTVIADICDVILTGGVSQGQGHGQVGGETGQRGPRRRVGRRGRRGGDTSRRDGTGRRCSCLRQGEPRVHSTSDDDVPSKIKVHKRSIAFAVCSERLGYDSGRVRWSQAVSSQS